jgi:hypothetical protein
VARGPASDAVANLKAADAAMISAVGISAIASPLLRELLLSTAHRASNTDLVVHLATAGPPSTAKETHLLRACLDRGSEVGMVGPALPRAVEAALVKGRWYRPETPTWSMDLVSRCCEVGDDEAGAKELFDALVEAGFFASEKQRARALVLLASGGSADMMEHALAKVPLASVSKRHASEVLCAAVGVGAARVRMVLNQGVDPNVASRWDMPGKPWAEGLALHMAVQSGNEQVVKLLLEHGAKMVPNGQGQSPLVIAEARLAQEEGTDTERAEIICLLEAWLETRKLPRDHEDMPTFVDGDAKGLADDDGQKGETKTRRLGKMALLPCFRRSRA